MDEEDAVDDVGKKLHDLEEGSQALVASSCCDGELSLSNGNLSDDDSGTEIANHLYKTNSSNNVFVELAVCNEGFDRSTDMASDSDDSIIFCSDPEAGSQPLHMEKPKDILSEVSDILMSLSDDQRFTECINFSNNGKLILNGELDKHRSSVDLIFTYNVLSVLYNKLRELKAYFELLKSENNKLLKESQIAEAEHFAYQVQINSLQKVIDEQKEKIKMLSSQLESEMKFHAKEKKHFDMELKSVRKKYEEIVCEKDSAVVRYAKNESELMNIRKEKENILKRLKNVETERDDLSKKVKNLNSEKMSMSQTLDAKKTELSNALKDIEKLKEELSCKDIKAKWVEENLQKDMNRYKEQNVALLAEIEDLKKQNSDNQGKNSFNSETAVEKDNCSPEIIVNEIHNAETIHENDDSFVKINNLTSMVEKMERQQVEYEKNLNEKDVTLREHLDELEVLRSSLKLTEDQLNLCREEVDRLKEINDELQQDMESCREREAEMLNFTEKLTAKNVILQSEYSVLEAKKAALESDRAPLEERIKELEDKVASLSELLEKETYARAEEIRELTEQVESETRKVTELSAKLEEQEAENQSLKHKYSSTIRALSKEVQQYRKCKHYDSVEYGSSNDSVCLGSRTSSCNSLNEPPQLPKLEPDRQTLIERIVKLQKINAKHSEKVEFLEEHIAQLLAEIKKKNRVIQHYVLREQSGVLSSDSMDQHKAELSKYGGIMATLYNPKGDNNSLSLELSLEINRKLQAVLEDTILKNITLKDSIETLGKEIEKLTSANVSKEN